MDAVTLLKGDHETVEGLFRRWESLSGADERQKRELVDRIVRELSIHAAIEEKVLYPGLRETLPDGDRLAREALHEHQEAKETLAELDRMDAEEARFDDRVDALIADVRHHVDEEEREMLPKLAAAVDRRRLDEMGRAMESAKSAAPTRPHPHAPSTPPGNLVTGPVAGVVDRVRDAVAGRTKSKAPPTKDGSKKKSTRTKTGSTRASGGRKRTPSRPSGVVIQVTAGKDGGWRAARKGSNRAVARADRKDEVVRKARGYARARRGRLVIQTADGRVQEDRSYGD